MNKPSIGPARSRGRPPNRGRPPTGSSTSYREHCQPAIGDGPTLDVITSAVKRRWGNKQRNRVDTASTLQASVAFGNDWWLLSTKRPTANGSNFASDFNWPGIALPATFVFDTYQSTTQTKTLGIAASLARDKKYSTCTGGQYWKPGRLDQTSHHTTHASHQNARGSGYGLASKPENFSINIKHIII